MDIPRSTPNTARQVLFTLVIGVCFALSVSTASAAPPTILRAVPSAVSTTTATLQAEVKPGDKARFYHFEYGPADCASNPCTSTSPGTIPKEPETKDPPPPVTVEAELTGLAPETTYHFRLLVGTSATEATSPDRTFTTFGAAQEFGPCPNDALRRENPAA